MSATYNTSTNIGKVRALIFDTDITNALFQDADLQAYLDLNGSNVFKAAAAALEALAANRSRFALQISTGAFSKQFESVASIRMLAQQVRDQYQNAPAYATANVAHTPEQAAQIAYDYELKQG